MSVDLSNYVEVPERIAAFREKHPEGSFQTTIVELPEAFRGKYVAVEARAYRTPDDECPGIDIAWEPVPGKTPYTLDSELMNASTSAVGRAIVYALAADAHRDGKIASANEVRNRQDADAEQPAEPKEKAASKAQKAAITRRCNELEISDEHKPLLIEWAGGMPLTEAKADKLVKHLMAAKDFGEVWRLAEIPNPVPVTEVEEQTLEDAVLAPGAAEALGLMEHDE